MAVDSVITRRVASGRQFNPTVLRILNYVKALKINARVASWVHQSGRIRVRSCQIGKISYGDPHKLKDKIMVGQRQRFGGRPFVLESPSPMPPEIAPGLLDMI